MKHHRRWFTISMLLGIITVTETAWAVPVTMPAGSTVWMEFDSNACGTAPGEGECLGSNQPGPNPPNGIPYSTFGSGSVASGMAEVLPDRVRSYLSGNTGSFMYISMLDAYTVHGNASGPFDITVRLGASGVAQSIWQGAPVNEYWLYNPYLNVEIGTFDPSTAVPYSEQFRVTPFGSGNSATHFITGIQRGASAFTRPLSAETSYTRSVGVGDAFNLAYGVNSSISTGAVDLRNTAVISFDLPQGVYLTSAQGGTFGAPVPVPAAAWLFGSGLLGLIGVARRKTGRHA